jgi:hypothetical protein
MQNRPRVATIVFAVIGLGAVALVLMWSAREDVPSDARGQARSHAPAAIHPVVTRQAATPAASGGANAAASGTEIPGIDAPNLFATFQLAIGSNDPAALRAGLSAWRACAGYVGLGTWDLNDWLDMIMPPGLTVAERDRRAKHARADAARCAGFALQTEAEDQAANMTKKALALGMPSEQLRHSVRDHVQSDGLSPETTKLSCAVVSDYQQDPAGIRLISLAMRGAARARPSHVLNSTPQPASNLAVTLAFCDLDPSGCDAHSNELVSACVQTGVCSYTSVEDYLRGTTPPDIFAQAQPLRQTLVQLVHEKQCRELFE